MKLRCCNPKLALFSKETFTGVPELMIAWFDDLHLAQVIIDHIVHILFRSDHRPSPTHEPAAHISIQKDWK